MFIAEEFYDVKMIEQLKLLDQNLSFSNLKYCQRLFIQKHTFFSPQLLFMIPVAFMAMMKQAYLLF